MKNDRKFQFQGGKRLVIALRTFATAASQQAALRPVIGRPRRRRPRVAPLLIALVAALAPAAAAVAVTGPYSGEPLPRYAALKANLAYLRKGPGTEYAVDWELSRRHLPVRIVGEYGPWRRVELHDGGRGWIHRVMLTSRRYIVSRGPVARIRRAPDARAAPVARLMAETPLKIRACRRIWCQVEGHGVVGWAAKLDIWGVDADEILK